MAITNHERVGFGLNGAAHHDPPPKAHEREPRVGVE